MDGFVLRCNSLRCRATLSAQGVVTTCSHLYCVDCASTLFNNDRICPACGTNLPEPDDVVLTNLNPTDDYKTSVLSGLAPSVIMEIAARAMSFWTYQSTQEIVYQEYMSKILQEKYNDVNGQVDNIIREANTEIGALREKIIALQNEQTAAKRKNLEINDSLQDKNRQFQKLQGLYDKLKRKSLISPIQNGATQNLDEALTHGNMRGLAPSQHRGQSSQVQNTSWHQGDVTPRGQRIKLDTSRNANMMQRTPLGQLPYNANQQNFMSTPRNAKERQFTGRGTRHNSVQRPYIQGRGL